MGKNCFIHISSGWNNLEFWDNIGGIRWTKQKAICYLKPAGYRNKLYINCFSEFNNYDLYVSVIQNEMRIIDTKISLQSNWNNISIELQNISDMPLTIEFVTKTWSPQEIYKSSDCRDLGIAIQEVALR
ncbi:hypothetical protein D5R95_02835 [Methanosalsum natronophilum]|uniref:Uncharacterized protein n=1 Tax=Methanosalsum natronophilum TaxID=768733 RepID=A0A424Z2S6_9EURY|nr:MAG: hypothetical protein D5R95_02835 [Methanosalsum natronophilum]